MYFISTGMSHSHTLKDLSSEVDTNLRFSSQNVIVFTAPEIHNDISVTLLMIILPKYPPLAPDTMK